MTGSLDEVMITNIRERLAQLHELDARREAIISSIEKQGKLSLELMQAIVSAETLPGLKIFISLSNQSARREQVQPKEKGLEPLAQKIFDQGRV